MSGMHALDITRDEVRENRTILTAEQQAIVAHDPSTTLIVEAGAGTGKTSTLVAYARRWRKRGLYLAFNKPIAEEAKKRFPQNITAKTAHSFAYQALGVSRFQDRLVGKIRRQNIREAGFNLNTLYLTEDRMMKAVLSAIHNFCIDGGGELKAVHCGLEGAPTRTQEAVLPIIGGILKRFINFQESGLPFTHDIYLKHYELFGKLAADVEYLLVDEAQDLNPVLISLVRKSGLPAIVVGDSKQSIYAFRGAVSAMSEFGDAPRLPLSQSWRYGAKIAAIANHILSYSIEPAPLKLLGRPGHETAVERYLGKAPARCFILARTNARLFEGLLGLIETQRPFYVAGGFDTLASQLLSAWALSRNLRHKVTDPFVRLFDTWEQLAEEAADEDPDAKKLVKIVTEYGDAIPDMIEKLRGLHRVRMDDAHVLLSTAHKAKGLEAPIVVLLDDFDTPKELREKMIDGKISKISYDQEINLLYVAATRAMDKLLLSDKLHDAFMPAVEGLHPETRPCRGQMSLLEPDHGE